jgi:hypothetical protein
MSANRTSLLKTLNYFPVAGFFIKLIMDGATGDSMTAASSIIRDSCIALYLACMLWFLFSSQEDTPKFGVFVIFTTLMVYATSIVMNSYHLALIDSNKIDMQSYSFWVFAEIILLFKYMSGYVLNHASGSTWLGVILLVAIIHAIIIGLNFRHLTDGPTDDVTIS